MSWITVKRVLRNGICANDAEEEMTEEKKNCLGDHLEERGESVVGKRREMGRRKGKEMKWRCRMMVRGRKRLKCQMAGCGGFITPHTAALGSTKYSRPISWGIFIGSIW